MHPEKPSGSIQNHFPTEVKVAVEEKESGKEKKKKKKVRATPKTAERSLHVTRVCALPASARSRVRHATCQINE